MAATHTLGKAGLLTLLIVATLNLQGAEAQFNNTNSGDTPRWAVAVIVMLAIILAMYAFSCCLVPLCTGMCKKGGDGCQSGCSFGK